MEGGDVEVDFQWNYVPLCAVVGLQVGDLDHLQVSLGQFKEVKEWLPRLEIVRVVNQE